MLPLTSMTMLRDPAAEGYANVCTRTPAIVYSRTRPGLFWSLTRMFPAVKGAAWMEGASRPRVVMQAAHLANARKRDSRSMVSRFMLCLGKDKELWQTTVVRCLCLRL